ncbi:MAG TPA: hypothetical protein VFK41_13155 [Nocardioidaceae bacterium]|nr:hypothetical protein [Nocardioidaceae bacterium]
MTDVGSLGIFELDGNPDGESLAGVDWEDLFTASGTNESVTLTGANLIQRTFEPDASQPDSSYFTSNGGGVKDIAPISKWGCKTQSNPTPKDDLFNAYAMLAEVTGTGARAGHLILYLGSERQQNQGDAFAGFWINQKEITCDLDAGAFLSDADHQRTNGDLLIVADYKSGGDVQQLAAYEWQGNTVSGTPPVEVPTTVTDSSNLVELVVQEGSNLADCDNVTASAQLCATTNDANVTTEWPPNDGGYPVRTPGTFVEVGLDLTAIYGSRSQDVPCFSQLFAETRSSEQPTATLKDFTEDSFDTCAAPGITTNLFEEKGTTDRSLAPQTTGTPPVIDPASYTVTLPAQVYDTVTLSGTSGTPSGTVTYSLWTNATCTTPATSPLFSPTAAAGHKHEATVTLTSAGAVPESPTLTFDTAGSYWFKASYSGSGRNLASESVCASEPLIVQKPSPSIATTAGTGGEVGVASISDTANVTGGYFPATAPSDGYGSVTFQLFGPYASGVTPTCASTEQVDLNGSATGKDAVVTATRVSDTSLTATSPAVTPSVAGTYQWRASYSGNSQNNAANATTCNDAAEDVLITRASPTLKTKISISDKVKVTGTTGGGAISGSVVFTLYGPLTGSVTEASCIAANKVASTVYTPETVTLNSSGEAVSSQVSVVAGTYAWGVEFTPDTSAAVNYTAGSSTCEKEVAAITYVSPSPIP